MYKMLFQLFYVIVGLLCGYLMIHWLPPVTPFHFTHFITELIFNPLRSFLAMACFLIGFLANAAVIRTIMAGIVLWLRRKQVRWGEWLISCCGMSGSFYWLFQAEAKLTVLFFIFSFIYGMISLDFYRSHSYKRSL
ncbi:hypothetical protein [Parageobacillus thermoglucosidasius]|uniref:Uncharacterized protein n=1 Tax=Parageobacillus thermoglucosidasius TaxID=1426 RepID=A0AAN1D7S3_PARTM|nr:hypothetical protein [Parageobacillus thermoglucosidasius]ALF11347.1 hypothetical protein AOT13_15770 [Parageobacillus thermoglucosidasius]ANZ31425.1 hypothetical protein BCV53_15810 [Parageobacillus thermoglucosidasius]APM82162.1 hypothetical protein BCV54_15820 [Parageobacillus thermoglucosidasius]KJX69107.1 membrane protein [Parageobacillus thermoglucosidasius]OUM93418.1 MAG: hypothetical protein BAA00_04420 [Parageobacillus thermoglucosidasius]